MTMARENPIPVYLGSLPSKCLYKNGQLSDGSQEEILKHGNWNLWMSMIRNYRLGAGNILQEYIYLSKDGNSWRCAGFHNLNIVLDPTSSIAVLCRNINIIVIYYQEPDSDLIRILWEDGLKEGHWQEGPIITKALKGTKIAVVLHSNAHGALYPRIYCQDPHLHLREYYFNSSNCKWVLGDLNAGEQPRGTYITAEVVHGGDVDIIVAWRDEQGNLVSSSHSKTQGWDLQKRASEREFLDGRD